MEARLQHLERGIAHRSIKRRPPRDQARQRSTSWWVHGRWGRAHRREGASLRAFVQTNFRFASGAGAYDLEELPEEGSAPAPLDRVSLNALGLASARRRQRGLRGMGLRGRPTWGGDVLLAISAGVGALFATPTSLPNSRSYSGLVAGLGGYEPPEPDQRVLPPAPERRGGRFQPRQRFRQPGLAVLADESMPGLQGWR